MIERQVMVMVAIRSKEGECHLIDSKCTVEPPYKGRCSLCGRNNHDSDHCRLSAQGKGPNGEPLVNLANLVWFSDFVLDEQLGYARKDRFKLTRCKRILYLMKMILFMPTG